uniref:Origin recognition complex subunit 1 n=1 Tax=Plectus sambesii TaxID=2011161 RepID=A0A914VXB6_9BILA
MSPGLARRANRAGRPPCGRSPCGRPITRLFRRNEVVLADKRSMHCASCYGNDEEVLCQDLFTLQLVPQQKMNSQTPSSNLRSRNRKPASNSSPSESDDRRLDCRKTKKTNGDDSVNNENIAPTPKSCKKSPKRRAKALSPIPPPTPTRIIDVRRTPRSATESRKSVGPKKTAKSPATPRVRKREAKKVLLEDVDDDSLEAVRRRLHSSAVPDRMPCRDEEFNFVRFFVSSTLESESSRSLYISGIPGTGKTATVHQVIRHLRNAGIEFRFVEVNGMRLTEPAQVFSEIYRQLIDDGDDQVVTRISASVARRKLNHMFQTEDPERLPIVLLVDEMDLLCTRRQEILYDIFNWATMSESRLVVLAIANTLDLPERILTHRVSSRLGMSRQCFRPYSFQQIESILHDRLANSAAVENDAVEFVSRKVAAVTGDLRTALDIVRRSIEMALDTGKDVLTLKHVQSAVKELASRAPVEMIKSCSTQSKLLLRAIIAEYERTGHDEMPFAAVIGRYKELCAIDNVRPLPTSGAYDCCMRLASSRLLVAAPGKCCWTRKFRLGLPVEDVNFALFHATQ